MPRRFGLPLFALVAAAVLSPPTAGAETVSGAHQISSAIPLRVDRHIGFIPVNVMGQLPPFRMYVGGGQYIRGPWVNATIGRKSLSEELGYLRRRNWVGHGSFSDRRLTRSERRLFVELADFGRDADVLVVKRGHPACAGLTVAQARSIATGRTTSWSQVGAAPPGASDRITLRHLGIGEGFIEPRLGNGIKPRAGKPDQDGGIAAASRDAAVAGVTAWSRARNRSDVCPVPLNGVEPTDVSVHGLTYPAAYPIGFVAPKKLLRQRYLGKLLRRFVAFMQSPRVDELFRRTGMLLREDTPSSTPPSGGGGATGGPSRDAQGRSVNPVRDDAGVASALTGERLATEGGGYHWAFEGNSILRYVQPGEPCSQTEGRWTVVEGFRYSEHGGGLIARVLFELDGSASEHFLDVPNDPSGIAYLDGSRYSRSRDLPASC